MGAAAVVDAVAATATDDGTIAAVGVGTAAGATGRVGAWWGGGQRGGRVRARPSARIHMHMDISLRRLPEWACTGSLTKEEAR